ncbi:hypothetical protein [Cohnella silvisoli]|uniref:Glycosyl hydrolase family 32 N-terminal domain-containing protein n=1 Tax=Cohnella silvisoli TaxID=2873699 RepID=A0ABV1KRD3_9BACL|nr:hypothetical protein [Cohnella silvisoli]MCD9021689.1 hypothetical protein [Cohnella silvisoli]
MTKSLTDERWTVSTTELTQFTNANGVYQDGNVAMCRDKDGVLWALVGHNNLGEITLWRGTCVEDLTKQFAIEYEFEMGRAGAAFHGIPYPDGPRSRGKIWPNGLWIDPEDGRFYCYVHNETAWGAEDTSYTAYGLQEGEPDFRHIGLMTSGNQGKSWDFTGWVVTSSLPCWTELYRPDGMEGGQSAESFVLGAGDFCFYPNERDGYFYIFYSQITVDQANEVKGDHIYAARAPMAGRGLPGQWRKLYDGEFAEPGNGGRETAVVHSGNVPFLSYNRHLEQYMLTSYRRELWVQGLGACQVSFSRDLIHWSEPVPLAIERQDLSRPYFTVCNTNKEGLIQDTGRTFRLLIETNGTDVYWADVRLP